MCFALYAGTDSEIPESRWDENRPDVFVRGLSKREREVREPFTKPYVRYVGSTAGCGCDFPYTPLTRGEWLPIPDELFDAGQRENQRVSRESLVALIEGTGEARVELYALWDGDFAEAPMARESISLDDVRDPDFHFRERVFYEVRVTTPRTASR